MSQSELAAVGRAVAGITGAPPDPGFTRPLPSNVEKPKRVVPAGSRQISSTDPEALAVAAAVLGQKLKAAPVFEELEEEPPPKSEAEIRAGLLADVQAIKRDLGVYARKHGIDPNAKAAVDPAVAEAQRIADARKLVTDDAVRRKSEKRAQKERKKILKALR